MKANRPKCANLYEILSDMLIGIICVTSKIEIIIACSTIKILLLSSGSYLDSYDLRNINLILIFIKFTKCDRSESNVSSAKKIAYSVRAYNHCDEFNLIRSYISHLSSALSRNSRLRKKRRGMSLFLSFLLSFYPASIMRLRKLLIKP